MFRTIAPFAALLALTACSEHEFYQVDYSHVMGDLTITGRVCHPDRGEWLEGAQVYTHLMDADGNIYASVDTMTDADGYYELDRLVENRTYTVYVQYGSDTLDMFDVRVDTGDVEVPEGTCGVGADVNVAVVTGDYDDFEEVLGQVGVSRVELVNGQTGEELVQFLSDAEHLAEYDAVFFPGGQLEEDVIYDTDGSASVQVAGVQSALQAYVVGGGTLYVSDWSYDLVEQLWPDRIDFVEDDTIPDAAQVGEEAQVTADVVNHMLEDAIGSAQVDISFDLDAWPVMKYAPDGTRVYLKADVPYRIGMDSYTLENSPLLVSFEEGEGQVFFSSWRHESNARGNGLEVIRYIVSKM